MRVNLHVHTDVTTKITQRQFTTLDGKPAVIIEFEGTTYLPLFFYDLDTLMLLSEQVNRAVEELAVAQVREANVDANIGGAS